MTAREKGFTLAEVLAALVIMGIVISAAAQTLTWQAKQTGKGSREIETGQACRTALSLIEREVRQARMITSPQPGRLNLTRHSGQPVSFYVDDKDHNGIKDLYLEIEGVPAPAVSFIEDAAFVEEAPGRWKITLIGRERGVEKRWSVLIKQRTF